MSTTAFVLGNGESRKGIKIADLKSHGKVWACNAVYRTEEPDVLVAVDPKMIIEIAGTEYAKTHEVWSNWNHQYDKIETAKKFMKWFKPSLGWSSGPTALKHACDNNMTNIYILGFDYQGHLREPGNKNRGATFNNVFKDSHNYKKSRDEATYYGNWLNQTKRIMQDYPTVQFNRVIYKDAFKPSDLEHYKNFKNIEIEEFLTKFNLSIQK